MFEFEQIFKRTDAVQRHLAAPLLRSRLAYLGHRAEQGAKPSTLRGIAAFQVQAIHYLELAEEGQITPSEIATAAERWVTQHPARRGGNARGIMYKSDETLALNPSSPAVQSTQHQRVGTWLGTTHRRNSPV